MIARITGAATRAVLVALMVVTPALMLPGATAQASHLVVLIAIMGASFVFVEYTARSPSIVEFRDAAPLNRLRFLALLATVILLSLICRDVSQPTFLTGIVASAGAFIGNAIDVPLSPVRMLSLILPEGAGPDRIALVRTTAGLAVLISVTTLTIFFVTVRMSGWPARDCPFNIWINLPLFDPSSMDDVSGRLRRDGTVNVALGMLLPFLVPVVVRLAGFLVDPVTIDDPHTLIWTVTAWAFLPASTIMRGVALRRIAKLIEVTRHRSAHVIREEAQAWPV